MTAFLGIYKALFQYEPQSEEELAIEEDDLLYLLQKSDVDDWWSVKKRVIGSDAEEPVGLVPNNYIEEADVKATAKALYDYPEVQNADEEIAFNENDVFDVYDDRDPDWILCRLQRSGECGFIPGNYVEILSATGIAASTAVPAVSAAPQVSNVNAMSFPPPPKHVARATEAPQAAPVVPTQPAESADHFSDEEEAPLPPRPTRPTETRRASDEYYDGLGKRNDIPLGDSPSFQTWDVSEVVGRKKHKAKLAIGNSTVFFTPSKGTPQQWPINDLTSYDNEKKHIFFEFSNPYVNLEIHTGSTDVANEIMTILGELKGVYHASGLREVEAATKAPAKSSHRKQGKVIYDFIGESNDELTVKEGQIVHILDDKKSQDWWMCELTDTGRKGVIPAQFVEPINQLSYMANSLRSSSKFNKKSVSESSISKNWKDDVEQETSRKSSRKRAPSFLSHGKKKEEAASRSSSKKSKDYPDSKKTRIWVDRSGTFKVEAEFIGCVEGKVHLHKANGVKIAVAADKLCEEDLERVERMTGTSLDKYKPKNANSGSHARDKERERRRKIKEHEEREREREERERDRKLREQELKELREARDLLDKERHNLRARQERDLPPIQPPRPTVTSNQSHVSATSKGSSKPIEYDWFEFFLNCGVDVNNCQRYTINFEREQISEETLPDVQPSVLRTLGLREGDIIRVMKYLDQKFGRENTQVPTSTGGLFSEPDGSLKVSNEGRRSGSLSERLLPQQSQLSTGQQTSTQDDEAWTVKPAAISEAAMPPQKSEFTGSMQDLLDLRPLEPKKAPQPNLKDLEPVKTGSSRAEISLAPEKTGQSLAPLDPFKTGGHNLIPMMTGGFVMVPVNTGGMLPINRTGGLVPQTTFGMHPIGTILPVQKTGSGLIPAYTGGLLPQTTFGMQGPNNSMPLQRTGGALPLQQAHLTGGTVGYTGGSMPMPQTSFGINPTGGMAASVTGGNMMPMQRTGGNPSFEVGGMPAQYTIPQTSFGIQATGGFNLPQPGLSNGLTGGPALMPTTTFNNQMTGGGNMMPPNTFGRQITGGMNTSLNNSFGMGGVTNMGQHLTGGFPQSAFNAQRTGGQQQMGQVPLPMNATGGFQPQSQFGLGLQRTGGVSSLPQTSFNTGGPMQQPLGNSLTGGMNQLNNMFQNASISQPALQSQPTGFGFGNGPEPQQRQANLYNASADNPFGF
ncbi:LAME_0F01486g1_1 [Lachancea meyersii CBS 8951]|uniref:Actin cytoskeleton-regulatory complex protein SLA1 n=1 Tax=Lachancea meyersii CBS 8951 TaxID=1266667 RepID=A0A1G4JPW9_9SACH|nr:LAME_0F01486g1_1 [Lachancea meyersii CBS 8951]